ncbi:hypothetical protein GCM10010885_03360 [Alicyclobacillus cellulosilyticus]|uniref:Cell division protein FtsL n=1 Tax=Alicyclobacillus cellulosilyticus TaxID=1003997 RepID=A0A917K234_9BACL|nr:septum formation inhibitor [Alicyclobacillus cellulosilyticus]GGI97110.1 hypothetical protein GCM10010885_03360 [Alicyclobacillus cellulosilyticus]
MLATRPRWTEGTAAERAVDIAPQRRSQSQTEPERRFGRVSMFLCIGGATAALWFLAVNGARIDALNDHIAALKAQKANLAAVNAALTAQADTLAQPSRILDVAMHRLHMHYATPIAIQAGTHAAR